MHTTEKVLVPLSEMVKNNHEYVVALRRQFRRQPELSGQEYQTQQVIMQELQALGLEPQAIGGTGVVAQLKGDLPGKVVAVRADMDALPVQDEIDKDYKSTVPGVSHACGHDAHMAMLLGLAKLLTSRKSELPGSVRFIFQPNEEQLPGGAQAVIADGALDGVEAVIGAHVWQPIEVGHVGITYGPMMAAPDEFILTIKGRGGHGAMPHQTIDPITIGAQIIVASKVITSTYVDPCAQAVISMGVFKAGENYNIIPDTAVLKGTIRTFDENIRQQIHQHFAKICQGICLSAGAQYELETIMGFPAVINDPEVAAVFFQAAQETLGNNGPQVISPVLGGEDFSCYLEKVKGAFVFIGVGNSAQGCCYPQHHPKYELDEDGLRIGVEVMARAVYKLAQ